MVQLPFHKRCQPLVEKLLKKLEVTSIWVCKIDWEAFTNEVVGFAVGSTASPMEKVSDLFGVYNLHKTPKLKEWVVNQPQDNLIFQVKSMPPNDRDRLEYIINKVDTVLFAPIYHQDQLWGFIEIWETRQPRDYDDADFAMIETTVGQIAGLLAD